MSCLNSFFLVLVELQWLAIDLKDLRAQSMKSQRRVGASGYRLSLEFCGLLVVRIDLQERVRAIDLLFLQIVVHMVTDVRGVDDSKRTAELKIASNDVVTKIEDIRHWHP